MKMRKLLALCLTTAFILGVSTEVLSANSHSMRNEVRYLPQINFSELDRRVLPFNDAIKGAWYYQHISYLDKLGVINGVSPTKFAPNNDVTRAEFAKFLASVKLSYTGNNEGTLPFTDVPKDQWYSPYIIWAYENGIIEGKSEITFCPEDKITREEAATMLYRYIGKEKFQTDASMGDYMFNEAARNNTFLDESQVSDFAKEPVAYLRMAGIFRGDGNFNFNPKSNLRRSETTKILACYLILVTKPTLILDGSPPLDFIGEY